MFIPGLQMCTNEITIVGIFFFSNFEYGGANVTDLAIQCICVIRCRLRGIYGFVVRSGPRVNIGSVAWYY
jgi:hypothetical protein